MSKKESFRWRVQQEIERANSYLNDGGPWYEPYYEDPFTMDELLDCIESLHKEYAEETFRKNCADEAKEE